MKNITLPYRMGGTADTWKVIPLASDLFTVWESPDPQNIYLGSPSIEACDNGRFIATFDLFGPGVESVEGPKAKRPWPQNTLQGKIFTSDDGGETWNHRLDFPFMHARVFKAGGKLYVLGHCGNIKIISSEDNGTTWSEVSTLSQDSDWTQAPANVWYANGNVYIVMMKITTREYRGYFISILAPVLMKADMNSDLKLPESWSYSTPVTSFRELVPIEELDYFGLPFYPTSKNHSVEIGIRKADAIGWHEAHVIQIVDPDHVWHDPNGRTFHIIARSDNHRTNFAAMAKVTEAEDGTMTLGIETVPSGKKMVFLPLPGGQMKFHILYDEQSKLFWLVSSQTTDSMTKIEKLDKGRYGLPYNQRNRLQLSFSKNLVDWCFAGYVDAGKSDKESRHYCSMTICGEDLLILSRSGDARARNPHDVNLITFHRIANFRELVY